MLTLYWHGNENYEITMKITYYIAGYVENDTMKIIREIFQDRVITVSLWPPRFLDLTVCDYCYLWGKLKNKVYVRNPNRLHELNELLR